MIPFLILAIFPWGLLSLFRRKDPWCCGRVHRTCPRCGKKARDTGDYTVQCRGCGNVFKDCRDGIK